MKHSAKTSEKLRTGLSDDYTTDEKNIPQVVKQLSIIWRSTAIVLYMHQLHKKAFRLHKGRAMATPILSTKNIGKKRSATSVWIKDTLHHIEKPIWTATEKRIRRMTKVVGYTENQSHIPWLAKLRRIFKRPRNHLQLWSA